MVKAFLKHKYSDISDEYRTINEAKKLVVNEIGRVKCKTQILTLDKVLFRDAIVFILSYISRYLFISKKVGQELGYKEMKSAKKSKALEVFFTPKKDTIVRRTRSSVEVYDRGRGKIQNKSGEDLGDSTEVEYSSSVS